MTIVIRLVFALLGALGAVQVAAQTDFTDSYSSSSRYLVWVAIVLGGGAFGGWLIGVILGSAAPERSAGSRPLQPTVRRASCSSAAWASCSGSPSPRC